MIELPLNLNPVIRTWQPDAFDCGIITAKHEKYIPYILNDYIGVRFQFDPKIEKIKPLTFLRNNKRFEKDKVLTWQDLVVPYSLIDSDMKRFVQAAKDALERGFYINGLFNYYYIPGKPSYGKHNFDHDYLLYGYDETADEFLCAGYWNNGKYESRRVKSKDFEASLDLRKPAFDYEKFWMRLVTFNDGVELHFEPETVKKELLIYLNSESFDNTNCVYGTKAIQSYVEFLMNSNSKTEGQAVPLTQLFNLKERAELMKLRFEYMSKNGYLPKGNDYAVKYKNIIQCYTKTLNIWLKYLMTKIPELKIKVCDEILRALDTEVLILEQVVDTI